MDETAPVVPQYTITSTETTAPKRGHRRRTTSFVVGGATALALCVGGGGVAFGASIAAANTQNAVAALDESAFVPSSVGTLRPGGVPQTTPFGESSGTGSATGTSTAATAATDAQKLGVVTIVSDLYYSDTSQAAGTGIVFSSDGQILTNNHVIEGATSIDVTIESTGATYEAQVVGTDATDDIAVLQLVTSSGADVTGLTTATLDTSRAGADALAVGDAVTSVGNAEGTGDLVAAAGTVTALGDDITVGNEGTGSSESLTGLIQVDADVVSGDSGGPLVDAEGEVTGIVTAASSGTADIVGFAIPISTAVTIADQILSGVESETVSVGATPFLGVQLATAQTAVGATVADSVEGTPAAGAGFAAGDVISSVDGVAVADPDALSAAIAAHEVGDPVSIGYTTAAGAATTATVTLMAGPAA